MRLADLPSRDGLFSGRVKLLDIARDVDRAALLRLLDEAFDALNEIVAGASDADVVFLPADREATGSEDGRGWTAGHIVSHVTAGLEETASSASTLARGAEVAGRPRYEVPWQRLSSTGAVQARLTESRRICRAFLDTWPDEPHLDNVHTPVPPLGPLNAVAWLLLSLRHAAGHLDQLQDALRQARASE